MNGDAGIIVLINKHTGTVQFELLHTTRCKTTTTSLLLLSLVSLVPLLLQLPVLLIYIHQYMYVLKLFEQIKSM